MRKLILFLFRLSISCVIVYWLGRVYNLYEKSKLNDCPYDPNVWGNVADWVLIFCTIISIAFVAFTIIFQFSALKAQIEVNRIEKQKYIKFIKPNFELKINGFEQNEGYGVCSITIEALDNTAKHINTNIILNSYMDEEPSIIKHENQILQLGETSLLPDFEIEILKISGEDGNITNSSIFDVSIEFKDLEGTNYIKKFECKNYGNGIDIIPGKVYLKSTKLK